MWLMKETEFADGKETMGVSSPEVPDSAKQEPTHKLLYLFVQPRSATTEIE